MYWVITSQEMFELNMQQRISLRVTKQLIIPVSIGTSVRRTTVLSIENRQVSNFLHLYKCAAPLFTLVAITSCALAIRLCH